MILAPPRKLWTPTRKLWTPPRRPVRQRIAPRWRGGTQTTAMGSGAWLLDSTGKFILDASGKRQLSDGGMNACCCGDKCFQLWLATYNCDTLAWELSKGGWYCLPAGTDQSWTGSGCYWQRYVATATDCTADGDCAALADTATPDPPLGGAEPDACCDNPCSHTCGCATIGRYATVTFDGVENGLPCTGCGDTAPYSPWYKHGTGTLGTYRMVYVNTICDYQAVVHDVTFCKSFESSATCPSDIDTSTVADGSIMVLLHYDGASTWSLTVDSGEIRMFYGECALNCDGTAPLSFTNTLTSYAPCGFGPFAFMINGTAVVTFDPCTP